MLLIAVRTAGVSVDSLLLILEQIMGRIKYELNMADDPLRPTFSVLLVEQPLEGKSSLFQICLCLWITNAFSAIV